MVRGQQPTFDVASIKVVNLASHPVFGTGAALDKRPRRIHLCCVGMFSLLMRAYDVDLDQIIALPDYGKHGPNLYGSRRHHAARYDEGAVSANDATATAGAVPFGTSS